VLSESVLKLLSGVTRYQGCCLRVSHSCCQRYFTTRDPVQQQHSAAVKVSYLTTKCAVLSVLKLFQGVTNTVVSHSCRQGCRYLTTRVSGQQCHAFAAQLYTTGATTGAARECLTYSKVNQMPEMLFTSGS